MYKTEKCIMFKSPTDWTIGYWMNFKTESDYNSWMKDRLAEGLVYIEEKSKEIQQYPQVLRLNLKYSLGGYSSIIERFESKEEYNKYCDWKLSQGYKVIGSESYLLKELN